MWKKRILSLVITTILVLSTISIITTNSVKGSNGTTLYVGGSGPGNYTTIQAAIDDATEGYTIFVYDGVYYENLDVNKSLTIQSKYGSANCIVWAANSSDHVFFVHADYVNISGFTIKGASQLDKAGVCLDYSAFCIISSSIVSNNYCGIYIYRSSNNSLTGNNISNNFHGIYLYFSSENNSITTNTVNNNFHGIYLVFSSENNSITTNTIANNTGYGITLYSSSTNTLTTNTITNNEYGIYLDSSTNTLTTNTITNNEYGIELTSVSGNNRIYHNNFINNTNQAFDGGTNSWDNGYPSGGNYWSDFDTPPEGAYDHYTNSSQDVLGYDGIVDRGYHHPGLNPYNITGGSNQDQYPLLEPLQCIILYEGWNLIGWCGDPTTAGLLGENISGCTTVCKFNGDIQRYTTHVVGIPYNDFTITGHMGLFIYVTESSVW